MRPEKSLPYHDGFKDAESYVESLLSFISTSEILQTLCGGVHILDIFTRSPSLYITALPYDWREWFALHAIEDILDLLLREDLSSESFAEGSESLRMWRGKPSPPESLLRYIEAVRRHSLSRDYRRDDVATEEVSVPKNVTVGMKTKKIHEVSHFAKYVSALSDEVGIYRGKPVTHLIDFGSGQNYLGRTLASSPYHRRIVAVESQSHNVTGAKAKDIYAKVSHKNNNRRNKKAYRGQTEQITNETPIESDKPSKKESCEAHKARNNLQNISYIAHKIVDGSLNNVFSHALSEPETTAVKSDEVNSYMVISLHSCGNLLHHGLRTIELNASVGAVALVGCCYNLMTERLGPTPHTSASLRFRHPRLEKESKARDAHGFPLSRRLENYQCPRTATTDQDETTGIRLNITARMLAVQATSNWSREDSASSFQRHFFRALLQRFFLDHHVVGQVGDFDGDGVSEIRQRNVSLRSTDETAWSAPLTIGKLSKKSYQSFSSYASDAIEKAHRIATEQSLNPNQGTPQPSSPKTTEEILRYRLEAATKIPPDTLEAYLKEYSPRKHEVEVLWSLMAFSAEVIEAIIVVDRWLYLCELEDVGPNRAWVETVWQYGISPRNLVIVGVKR